MKILKPLFVALLLAVTPMTAQTADEIIDNYFENTGGKDAWLAVKSMEASGEATFGPQKFNFVQKILVDGRMHISVELQGQSFVPQAFDGKNYWSTNFQTMEPEAADAETSENYSKNDAKDFPDPFLNYKDKGYSVELMGEETVEGVDCFKIKLTKNPIMSDGVEQEVTSTYYFDKETFVPIMSESVITSGPQKGVTAQLVYSDYEEAGGVYYAYTQTGKFNGQVGQTISIKEIKINPEIDEAVFVMPATSTSDDKN